MYEVKPIVGFQWPERRRAGYAFPTGVATHLELSDDEVREILDDEYLLISRVNIEEREGKRPLVTVEADRDQLREEFPAIVLPHIDPVVALDDEIVDPAVGGVPDPVVESVKSAKAAKKRAPKKNAPSNASKPAVAPKVDDTAADPSDAAKAATDPQTTSPTDNANSEA